MIIGSTLAQARLDAIEALTNWNTCEVSIFYDDNRKVWCCKVEEWTDEEWEELERKGVV